MLFDWDKKKCKSNIIKHGIDFKDVIQLFGEPYLRKIDSRKEYGEKRWIALGKINNLVAIVVFTIRKNRIRIISARQANKKERQIYHERFK